jgi:FMNH2-dependent dimethyl sulfone monooxygenase
MSENATAAPLKFAYWVPNVSGGLVTSSIEQRTDWGFDYNKELAIRAERAGFDYALTQVRYMASYGAEYQHESSSFSIALLLVTERLKVIAAVHPGLWHPGVLAKLGATADHLSGGRLLLGFLHYHEEVDYFGRHVLPIVRELEADRPELTPVAAGHW